MTQEKHTRVPPHSAEAEQGILASLMLFPEAFYHVTEHLVGEDFYLESHQAIFKALMEVNDENGFVDLTLLTDRLRGSKMLEKVGGFEHLTKLARSAPAASNIPAYVRVVKAKAVVRKIIETAHNIAQKGYEDDAGYEALLNEAEASLLQLGTHKTEKSFHSMEEILPEALSSLEKIFEQQGQVAGVGSGFLELDEMTTGFHPADLVIVAARPAMGKTAFGLSLALNVALRGEPVLVFSLEMSQVQLAMRVLCAEARINSQDLRQGRIKPGQWHVIVEAANRLAHLPLFIDDSPFLSPREVRAKSKKFAREFDLRFILIDYLQLMVNPEVKESRQVEVSGISRGLKLLAKELGVPIMALAQLSRAVESRADKKPVLADLRESGAIEQDADTIAFLYRQEYYDRLLGREPAEDIQGVCEVIIGKQRNGPTGTVRLAFLEQFARFENLSFRSE